MFETDRTGSDSVIINLLSLLTVFLLDSGRQVLSWSYSSYQGGGGTSCCGVKVALVTNTGIVGVGTGSGSKSWSQSLPDSVSQHVQLGSLNVDKVSRETFPSYWHILGLSIVFSKLGVRGGQSRLKSTCGGVAGPPFNSFPDSVQRNDCMWEPCKLVSSQPGHSSSSHLYHLNNLSLV